MLLRSAGMTPTSSVSFTRSAYAIAVAVTQGANSAAVSAGPRAADPEGAAPGLALQLSSRTALAAHLAGARLNASWLVAADDSNGGFLVPRSAFGSGANQVGVTPQGWLACAPCSLPLGTCTAVPSGGERGGDQLGAYRGTALAAGVALGCSQASSSPGERRVHCQGDGDMRVTVTLSLQRFAMAPLAASPQALPAFLPPPPLPPASCGAGAGGGACARAAPAAVTCSCGAHGTLLSNGSASGACGCVCADGWVTDPNQDLFSPAYCNVQQTTLAAMGNPDVAAGAVPASALVSGGSGGGGALTPAGWALIVGVFVAITLVCICCYRRERVSACVHHGHCSTDRCHLPPPPSSLRRYGRYRHCGRRRPDSKPPSGARTSGARTSGGSSSAPRSKLRRLSSGTLDALRRMMALKRLREGVALTVRCPHAAVWAMCGARTEFAFASLWRQERGEPRASRSHHKPHRHGRGSPAVHPTTPHRSRRAEAASAESDASSDEADEEAPQRSSRRERRARHSGAGGRHSHALVEHGGPPARFAPAAAPYALMPSPLGSPAGAPRLPSAPLDPGYAHAMAYHTYSNASFDLNPTMSAEQQAHLLALAAAIVQQQQQQSSPVRAHAPAPPPEWPQFSPPQAPSRARTPRARLPAPASPLPLPTRQQALRSLARELQEAAAHQRAGSDVVVGDEQEGTSASPLRVSVAPA